ncbi:MAG: fumarate reductase/succinate dehydrogenase flavoprotein subunit, partial [Bdellovibrionota bacterium]
VRTQIEKFVAMGAKGTKTVMEYYRELGHIMWDKVGMERNEKGLKEAITKIRALRGEFWKNLKLTGSGEDLNKNLEFAGRVADYFELGELMARDALERSESCGGHFRSESATPDGEAQRKDDQFCHVAAWEYTGEGKEPVLHKEKLEFENVHLAQRSYK